MTKTNTCKAYQVSKGVKSTPNKTYRGVSPQACPSGAARVIDEFAMHPAWMCGEGPCGTPHSQGFARYSTCKERRLK